MVEISKRDRLIATLAPIIPFGIIGYWMAKTSIVLFWLLTPAAGLAAYFASTTWLKRKYLS